MTVLLNYPIGHFVLGSLCVAGFSLQHRHCSNPAAPNLQHTTNREQNDRCGNSTTQSQAPDDGYIYIRTCWIHKKWNKIASDIKLVFYSSTITVMHGPINIKPAFIVSCYICIHQFWRNLVQPITILPWRVSSQWVYLVSVSRTYCCDVAMLDVGTENVSIELPSRLLVSVNLHPGHPLQHNNSSSKGYI